jgi:hypothetical protein
MPEMLRAVREKSDAEQDALRLEAFEFLASPARWLKGQLSMKTYQPEGEVP